MPIVNLFFYVVKRIRTNQIFDVPIKKNFNSTEEFLELFTGTLSLHYLKGRKFEDVFSERSRNKYYSDGSRQTCWDIQNHDGIHFASHKESNKVIIA